MWKYSSKIHLTASRRGIETQLPERIISIINNFELNSLPHLNKTVLHLMNFNRGAIVNLKERVHLKNILASNYFL